MAYISNTLSTVYADHAISLMDPTLLCLALLNGGGHAEQVHVNAGFVMPIPESMLKEGPDTRIIT